MMTPDSSHRQSTMEEAVVLAEKMFGPDGPALANAQWQRLVLGKLTAMVLDADSQLTGSDLRQLLGIVPQDKSLTGIQPENQLPPEFGEIVRQIYGVNLQTDVRAVIPSDGSDDDRPDCSEVREDESDS